MKEMCIGKWFSTGGNFVNFPWGYFIRSGYIFGFHIPGQGHVPGIERERSGKVKNILLSPRQTLND